ncbi:MAG TPA: hypothetical protein VIH99_14385 [Bdellovibrionota bacterium]|jgi:hypothetical protein
MKARAIVSALLLSLFLVGVAKADEVAAQARKDINLLFFGGTQSSQRFSDNDGNCRVFVLNGLASHSTQITVIDTRRNESTIVISDLDKDVALSEDHDADQGIIHLTKGAHQTTSLEIERYLDRGLQKKFRVTVRNGFDLSSSCVVF